MGGSQSCEGLDLPDYEDDSDHDSDQYKEDKEDEHYEDAEEPKPTSVKTLDDLDYRLKSLKLKYSSPIANLTNAVKLYLHVGGNTPKAKWIVSVKLTSYKFAKSTKLHLDEDEDEDEVRGDGFWILKVGSKIRARVLTDLQLKMFGDQHCVDFVDRGVWALKFFKDEEYREFVTEFQNCLFENVYNLKAMEENKVKAYQ